MSYPLDQPWLMMDGPGVHGRPHTFFPGEANRSLPDSPPFSYLFSLSTLPLPSFLPSPSFPLQFPSLTCPILSIHPLSYFHFLSLFPTPIPSHPYHFQARHTQGPTFSGPRSAILLLTIIKSTSAFRFSPVWLRLLASNFGSVTVTFGFFNKKNFDNCLYQKSKILVKSHACMIVQYAALRTTALNFLRKHAIFDPRKTSNQLTDRNDIWHD